MWKIVHFLIYRVSGFGSFFLRHSSIPLEILLVELLVHPVCYIFAHWWWLRAKDVWKELVLVQDVLVHLRHVLGPIEVFVFPTVPIFICFLEVAEHLKEIVEICRDYILLFFGVFFNLVEFFIGSFGFIQCCGFMT